MNERHASATRPAAGAPALHAAAPNTAARWQVRLLGAVVVSDGRQRIERWPSRAVAALLARLALWPEQAHAREELVDRLWPGVTLAVGRNRLRQALSTLKSLLEPAGALHSPVIDSDRHCVRVLPGARCPALRCPRLRTAGPRRPRCRRRDAYLGELMSGFYEDWIDEERQRRAAPARRGWRWQRMGHVATAAALRLRSAAAPQAVALLIEALSGRRVLLLDNFEQLVDTAAALVADLLAQLPLLHELVTSRRRLGLDGQREFALAALELPADGTELAEAADNPAVGLFVDRARAVRSDLHRSERHLAAIVQLARTLQGMPLAIELAASRVRSFTPAEMLSLPGMPGAGLDLLARTGPRAGLDPRHASMQRVIEWSWALVGDGPRSLLGALAVFRGGCTADATAAVAGQPAATTQLQLDERLGHSLPQAQPGADGATRFALYEPIREYAALVARAGEAACWRERYRAWMQHWAATLPATPSLVQARLELANIWCRCGGCPKTSNHRPRRWPCWCRPSSRSRPGLPAAPSRQRRPFQHRRR